MRNGRWVLALGAGLALVLAGCAAPGGDGGPAVAAFDLRLPPPAGPTRYPLSIDNCGMRLTFSAPPQRVLILNGTSVAEVESMVALGLGDRVLANAQHYGVSDQPGLTERIDALPTGGLSQNRHFDVPAEQVLASGADLVISTWSGGFDPALGFATREQLAAAGMLSLVNPVNCAMGKPDATPEERQTHLAASPRDSLDFLLLLGQIFDVPGRAHAVATDLANRIDRVRATVAGRPAKKMLVVFPGMSMMNDNGLPAVLAGGIYDRVLRAAGGVNSFPRGGPDLTRTINAEQLAVAEVDLLVVGAFTPGEVPEREARRLFDAYPGWAAARNNAWVGVSDGVYLGTTNAWAVEKIAKAAHPESF